MKNQEQFKRLIRAAFCFALLFVHAILFWHVWRRFYSPFMETEYWRRGHMMIVAFYLFWAFLLPRIYGGWRVGYLRVFHIVYSQGLGLALADLLIYSLIVLLTKRVTDPGPLLLMFLVQMSAIVLWGVLCTGIYLRIYPPRRVLLVYGGRPAAGLMKKISTRADRFVIGDTAHISEGMARIEEKIRHYQGVVLCDIPSHERNAILKYCYGKGIRSYTTPKISDLLIRSAESQHMFDTPLLLSRNTGLTIEQRLLKRAVDLALSLLALLPALLVMGATALCIKAEDGGRVIYKQKRLTMDGKAFFVYKFRSMREDAEKDGVARLAGEKDERITKVGSVIRALRLDELPQLFNILKGDMSIVGPRPERPEIAGQYEAAIPEFVYRLKVKAGLTGYAQVYGKYNTTAYDKLKLDLMYIQNYSLRLDIEIMLKTVQILFMKECTEGVGEGETTALRAAGEAGTGRGTQERPGGADEYSNRSNFSPAIEYKGGEIAGNGEERMEKGIVSIITPCYNGAKYLSETMESVISQTYADWEMFVVDDGSEDGSAELARGYAAKDPRIRLICQENAGSAAARNHGIRLAKGQYIALLDADDLWAPEFLEKQLAFMKQKQAACVYCSYARIDERSQEILRPTIARKVVTAKNMRIRNYIGCLSGLYDRSRGGTIYLREELRSIRDDYAYWIDVVNVDGRAYGNPEILAKYRVLPGSTTGNKRKLVRKQYLFYRKYLKLNPVRSLCNVAVWAVAGLTKFK